MLTRSSNINKHYCLNCGKEYQPQEDLDAYEKLHCMKCNFRETHKILNTAPTDVDEYDSKPGKRHGKKTVNKKVYRPDYLTQTT